MKRCRCIQERCSPCPMLRSFIYIHGVQVNEKKRFGWVGWRSWPAIEERGGGCHQDNLWTDPWVMSERAAVSSSSTSSTINYCVETLAEIKLIHCSFPPT